MSQANQEGWSPKPLWEGIYNITILTDISIIVIPKAVRANIYVMACASWCSSFVYVNDYALSLSQSVDGETDL